MRWKDRALTHPQSKMKQEDISLSSAVARALCRGTRKRIRLCLLLQHFSCSLWLPSNTMPDFTAFMCFTVAISALLLSGAPPSLRCLTRSRRPGKQVGRKHLRGVLVWPSGRNKGTPQSTHQDRFLASDTKGCELWGRKAQATRRLKATISLSVFPISIKYLHNSWL